MLPRASVVLRVLTVVTCAGVSGCGGGGAGRSDPGSGASGSAVPGGTMGEAARLQTAAMKAGAVLTVPVFERTPEEAKATAARVTAAADVRLNQIAAQHLPAATFASTFAALDDALYPVITAANRLSLMKETQTDAAMRQACAEAAQTLQEWAVGTQYREDVYLACRAFADAHDAGRRASLSGEELKLMRDTMRDYRRNGLALPRDTRDRVEELQKRLSRLITDFTTNITEERAPIGFTREELEGVPESFLGTLKEEGGRLIVLANVTPHYTTTAQNASREETRRRLETARFSIAMEKNTPVLNEMLATRDSIAALLGYATWADYQIEPRMAGTGGRALAFLRDMSEGLRPKFDAELAELAGMKASDTGDARATIMSWDWRYYQNMLAKRKYSIDAEALRVYFPLDRCLAGMFDIYQRLFGLTFTALPNPDAWAPGVTLHSVADAETGEPLGLFYLDLFPREGKYNHFAQFDIIGGKRLSDGRMQRPVAALVCNFTAPTADRPSVLTHQEVTTLFHEFGHALHTIVTRARFGAFAGTNVERDFVEAPSQMLEHWVWSPEVLDRFAADYRDPSQKLPREVLTRMNEARLATAGLYYRRQVALAMSDLMMHTDPPKAGASRDSAALFNRASAEFFIAPPAGTSMASGWGHLAGYDAGYYGYAWSEAIAADMATAFRGSPDGFMSESVGRRLRDEIYAVGGSRTAEESIRRFLGREWSLKPFFEHIGVK